MPGETLQAVAEIRTEFTNEVDLPIANGGKPSKEESKDFGFFEPCQASDQLAVVIEPFHAIRAIFDLRERKDATRDSKTEEFKFRIALRSIRFTLF